MVGVPLFAILMIYEYCGDTDDSCCNATRNSSYYYTLCMVVDCSMEVTAKAIGSTRPTKFQRMSPYLERNGVHIEEKEDENEKSSFVCTNGSIHSVLHDDVEVEKTLAKDDFEIISDAPKSHVYMSNGLEKRVR